MVLTRILENKYERNDRNNIRKVGKKQSGFNIYNKSTRIKSKKKIIMYLFGNLKTASDRIRREYVWTSLERRRMIKKM